MAQERTSSGISEAAAELTSVNGVSTTALALYRGLAVAITPNPFLLPRRIYDGLRRSV